jgi:hypothetical protein
MPRAPEKSRKSVGSGTYFIWAVGTDRVKIGTAKTPRTRIRELATGSAYPLRLLCVTHASEYEMHLQFSASRIDYGDVRSADKMGREWFSMSREMVEYVSYAQQCWRDRETCEALLRQYGIASLDVVCSCSAATYSAADIIQSNCPDIRDGWRNGYHDCDRETLDQSAVYMRAALPQTRRTDHAGWDDRYGFDDGGEYEIYDGAIASAAQ